MAELPVALARDTIAECVFEMRFSGAHPAVAELLPGLVFGKLPNLFKSAAPLPLANLPKVARDQAPQLKYAPTHTLEGPDIRMLFGPYSASVTFPRPYLGWARVEPKIIECMSAVFDTGMTGKSERFGLKYVNMLREGEDNFDLTQTRLRLVLGEFELRKAGTAVRAEIELNGCTTVVEVATGAKVPATPGNPELTGVLLSVNTVLSGPGKDRNALQPALQILHDTEKEIFFGLLADATLAKLGPSYHAKH